MDLDDMLPKKKPQGLLLGADLSTLSTSELEARLMQLEEERQRVLAEIKAKQSSRAAAESFFKS